MFILTKTKLGLYANWLERTAPNAVVEGSSPFSSPNLKTIIKGEVIPLMNLIANCQ